MKILILNQVITLMNINNFIPYPYFDINYATNTILISNHLKLESIDKETLNQITIKGAIKLLNNRYSGLGSDGNIILDYFISKINITKDLYTLTEGKKIKVY